MVTQKWYLIFDLFKAFGRLRAVTNRVFFPKRPVFLPVYAAQFELPLNKCRGIDMSLQDFQRVDTAPIPTNVTNICLSCSCISIGTDVAADV